MLKKNFLKFKNLSLEQIKISLDRLTRFKFTKEKYTRVFGELIISGMISPIYSKNNIANMPASELANIAAEIFNCSLYSILKKNCQMDDTYSINNIIKDYENTIFYNDEYTQTLLDNKIDYKNAISIISENDAINLKWLKSLNDKKNLKQNREKNLLKFPIEKVLVVEGLTEEILLPEFAKFMGYDFYAKGIQLISAGGKNQVVKLYYKLSTELKIPIFLLLDKDAEDNLREITPKLRSQDKIHLVSCGEFEDLLPQKLIVKTFNNEFENFMQISENDFETNEPYANILEDIYKNRGLHEFKKANFAKCVKNNISSLSDISDEIKVIIKEISENKS